MSQPAISAVPWQRPLRVLAAALVLGMSFATVTTEVVDAQPAAALGKPLPDGKLAAGTVSVRVVAGSASSPVVGTDVTLTVNGQPRVARTDSAGRATFAGLPAGAMVQAKVVDDDKQEISSEPFAVPAQGGARLMLSTKPFEGMAMPAAAAEGMPAARTMSGQPRPDRLEPPGEYVVRLTYDHLEMKDGALIDTAPPVGVPVWLVAYAADDSITVMVKQVGPDGLARFDQLDTTGATSYFALASLLRGAAHDQLIAVPTVLDVQGGVRVVLSAEKRDATAPPIDDYEKLIPRATTPVPANTVRVILDGVPAPDAQVTVFDATTGKALGIATVERNTRPDPTQVRGGANYDARPDLGVGALEIEIRGGSGTTSEPLAGVPLLLVDARDEKPIAGGGGVTGLDGLARITLPAGTEGLNFVKAVIDLNGKQMVSSGMDLSAAGGKLNVTAQWPAQGRPEANLALPYQPGQVLYAETVASNQRFRSLPFTTVPEIGRHANIYVYPRTVFTFDTHAFVEDQLLAIQGTFEVTNYAWAPFRAGPDGLLIPLPRRHKGGIVAAVDQGDVSVAVGEGFRITRPIPPGGRKFRAGYSLPIDQGEVDLDLALPLGSWQSELKIRQTPGMTVRMPPGIQGQTQTAGTGEPWFVVPDITLGPGKQLTMSIAGFPAEAAWRIWMPRVVGLTVIALLIGGLVVARRAVRATGADTGSERRREQLMTELVELEHRGATTNKDRRRREELVDELERLWGP